MAAIAVLFLGATGCGGRPVAASPAPAIHVVTGLYPLAQAIEQIGGRSVAVDDPVPSGSDPRTYHLTQAQIAEVHQAAVVVTVGGFQPALAAAAAGASNLLDLDAKLGTDDPYVWLDPDLMSHAVAAIAAALEVANPPAARAYRREARAYTDEVASTGIDYESTLSVCPRRVIITADGAFLGLARQYGLTDQVIGTVDHPNEAEVSARAGQLNAAGITTVFSEPFVPAGTVEALASAAHLRIRDLDPLTGPPPGGWPPRTDYIQLMEANLAALSSALGCPDTSTGM
jgi:zinc transport system substrate-binding protein